MQNSYPLLPFQQNIHPCQEQLVQPSVVPAHKRCPALSGANINGTVLKGSSATVTVLDSMNLWVSRRILEEEIVQKNISNSIEMVVFTSGSKITLSH